MDQSSPKIEALDAPEIAAEIARIRGNDLLGKAGRLRDLFEFLVERSLKDEPPKEVEIIEAVFSNSGRVTPEDSVARVYVHRLRKRLEEIAARQGQAGGVRLRIPRGAYRIIPERVEPAAGPATSRNGAAAWLAGLLGKVRSRKLASGAVVALVLLMLGNVVAWTRLAANTPSDAASGMANAAVWSPLTQSQAPLMIVVGDYYMFGEYEDRLFLTRLIRDFSINSKDDLVERYLTSPQAFDRYGDVALQYLPTSVAFALADLSPVLADRDVHVTLASELSDSQLKEYDIIYVGLISGLGKLKEPVFASSRFAVGESYDIIRDTGGGSTYTSEAFLAAPSDSMYRDYGLFKAFAGPTGKQIMVLAGARDTALMGISEALSGGAPIEGLAARSAGEPTQLEALFEVQGRKHVNLEARLLVSEAVDSRKIWSSTPGDMPIFPAR